MRRPNLHRIVQSFGILDLRMVTPSLAPLMMVPVLGWLVYRRVSRQFGRQPFRPKAQIARVVLLGLATAALVFLAATNFALGLAIGAGLLGGGIIAMVNLRLTRFEWGTDNDYYYPHPYVGAALSLLLVGRLVYRFSVLGGVSGLSGMDSAPAANPLTYGLIAILLGYYLTYLIGLMVVRSRHRGSNR